MRQLIVDDLEQCAIQSKQDIEYLIARGAGISDQAMLEMPMHEWVKYEREYYEQLGDINEPDIIDDIDKDVLATYILKNPIEDVLEVIIRQPRPKHHIGLSKADNDVARDKYYLARLTGINAATFSQMHIGDWHILMVVIRDFLDKVRKI